MRPARFAGSFNFSKEMSAVAFHVKNVNKQQTRLDVIVEPGLLL